MSHSNPMPTDETIMLEAQQSKVRVRARLLAHMQQMMDEQAQAEQHDVLAEMPWTDPSHSGEFEAVLS